MATEQPLASLAGLDILRRGGNAIDAAVAASLTLCVTLPNCCGLGGDFFALVYEAKTGRVHCLNSSGPAPSGLTLELLASKGEERVPLYGPLSVVVPGYVAGISALHKRFGKSNFEKSFSSAVTYSKKGFPASEGLARSIRAVGSGFSDSAKSVYIPTGKPPFAGDTIAQSSLGRTIEAVARGGAEAFYNGPPAEQIVGRLNDSGIPAQKRDFRTFRPEWVAPLRLNYRGTEVYEFPPNSMGATSLLMLKALESHDLSRAKPLSWERVNTMMKAAEMAYTRKDAILGDPRFGDIDLVSFMDLEGQAEVSTSRAKEGDTTAFSVIDGEGNIVSGIQSLFHHFGSRVFVEGCGVMMSNRGAGFSTSGPNKLEPGKRPLHTLSSMLLDSGDGPSTSIGCSGGDLRPMQHALFVTNIVDYHMSLEQAIDHPRFLRTGPGQMLAEGGYGDLSGLPYEIQRLPHPGPTGVCQGIQVLDGSLESVCDVRGDGLPSGY